MSISAINWAFGLTIAPGAKLVLIALANYADEAGTCWPSQQKLAEITCLSERAIRSNVRILLKSQAISIVRQSGEGGKFAHNIYQLNQRQNQPAAESTGGGFCRTPEADSAKHQRQILPTIPHIENHQGRTIIGEPHTTPPSEKPDRKTKPPKTIEITETHRTWARANGVTADLQFETEKMLDHYRGKGEKRVSWDATWRTWMRNSITFNRNRGDGNGNGKPKDKHELNVEAAQRLSNRFDSRDSGSSERDVTGSDTGDLFDSVDHTVT